MRNQLYCKILDRYQKKKFVDINSKTFQFNISRLEVFIYSTITNFSIFEILRKTIEFKKLNNNYFKSEIFEKFIENVYAYFYDIFVSKIIVKKIVKKNRVRIKFDNIFAISNNAIEIFLFKQIDD